MRIARFRMQRYRAAGELEGLAVKLKTKEAPRAWKASQLQPKATANGERNLCLREEPLPK